jgi:ferredoxin
MNAAAARIFRPIRDILSRFDAIFDRLYGWRYNPLYQSGTIAIALFLVLLVTGLYLLIFYRISEPYESVARISAQPWGGRWIRSLHRYASDAAILAVALHGGRMLVRGRSWGPRALAWLSGLVLLAVFLVVGWTGFVMVWDVHGQLLAQEGARLLDVLPIFAEPVARTFIGEQPMPGAFFFMNYFLHIAMPLGVALLLYIHVSRIARPTLLPPKRLGWGIVAVLGGLAVIWPVALAPPADPGILPESVPFNWFYGFWLPVTRLLPAGWVWLFGGAVVAVALTVPLWTRPRREAVPEPSWVDERSCVGCEQCFLDCPYDAIAMLPRTDGREGLVALVDPSICVSCGICSGSCAPMGVGPPGRRGRDQIARVRAFLEERRPDPDDVVLIACAFGAGELGGEETFEGSPVYAVSCAGNLHSSVVEFMVRSGVGGVLVAVCPGRDCWNREGPKWTEQRLFHDREAELKARVDRGSCRPTGCDSGSTGSSSWMRRSGEAACAGTGP